MQAMAAEAGAAHAEAFYQMAEFWVAIAFVIAVAGIIRPVMRLATGRLDQRAETIRRQIDEAQRLRDEAQDLLASCQRKHRGAVKEAGDILNLARQESERMTESARLDLASSLKRREELAIERLAQVEAKAIDEVRGLVVDVAIEAARRVLTEKMTGAKAEALVDAAIDELPENFR